MRMKCKRFTRLSWHFWSLAWRWTQSPMAAGTTDVGSQPAYLDQIGPESSACVIAVSAWTTATVSDGVEKLKSRKMWRLRLFLNLLRHGTSLNYWNAFPCSHLLHQFIAGIIVAWSWRCLVCRWIRSWSLLIVLLGPTSPTTPAGTTAAPYCRCSTRSLLSPPRPPTSPPSPPLHFLHKLTPIVSVKSSSSKVHFKTQQLNGQVVSAIPSTIRQGAVWGLMTVDSCDI